MNNPADSTSTETDTRPGEVRTYRGRTVEELIPQIRAELGAGAMILRERQGLTGGVGGFFAKRCVEIDAQSAPRLSVYADDQDESTFGQHFAQPTPDPFAGFAARLEQAASGAFADAAMPDPFAPTAPAMPTPAIPSAPESYATPAPAQPAMRASSPAQPAADFIAFDELAAEPEPEPVPTAVFSSEVLEPEATELTVPILLDVAPATPGADSVFRPRPLEDDSPELPSVFRQIVESSEEIAAEPAGAMGLRERLTGHGLSGALADQLITAAKDAAGSENESMLTVAAQAAMAAMLPNAAPLPLDGGVIAVVGASSSGKTRTVAALAAAYARAGHSVTVARLAGADRDDELTELLEGASVELVPAMKTKATVRAVNAAREEDLVILDTPSTTPGDDTAREALALTLSRFSPDAVTLCAPATFTRRALGHLVEHHAGLQVDGLIATHADQAGMLGTVAELSIDTRIPLGHAHSGLDLTNAISSLDPGALASDLLR